LTIKSVQENCSSESAELISLDSYKLVNSTTLPPVPPEMYFTSAKSGPATLQKIQRPVSVIIDAFDNNKDSAKNITDPSIEKVCNFQKKSVSLIQIRVIR